MLTVASLVMLVRSHYYVDLVYVSPHLRGTWNLVSGSFDRGIGRLRLLHLRDEVVTEHYGKTTSLQPELPPQSWSYLDFHCPARDPHLMPRDYSFLGISFNWHTADPLQSIYFPWLYITLLCAVPGLLARRRRGALKTKGAFPVENSAPS